jgi:hypothetical protein
MAAPKCPFMTPIISKDFACSLGQAVTVRNTPQVHCRDPQALAVCQALHERLKAAGLTAFDMEDDLTSTPHNVYLKIQYGGLLGLQADSGLPVPVAGEIADVHALVDHVTVQGSGLDAIDYAALAGRMTDYKPKRRRDRR